MIKRVKQIFGGEAEISPARSRPPIMILGNMRSGTTFLADKLCGHPQLLKVGLELSNVWEELTGVSIYGRCTSASEADYKPVYTYRFSQYLDQAIRESQTLKRSLMRLKLKMAKGNGRISYDWGNVIPVLKSTHLLNKIPFMNRVLPDMKIVYIIRDVYAQSASLKRHIEKQNEKGVSFYFPQDETECWSMVERGAAKDQTALDMEAFPLMWLRLNKMALQELSNLDRSQYCVISYEDLVKNQEETLKKVFRFLGLDEKHKEAEAKILVEQSKVYNTTTSGDLLTKWQDQLTDDEKAAIQKTMDEQKEDLEFIQSFLKN